MLARGPGGKSLPETAVWARQNGVAEIGGQALNERLHGSVAFLSAILHRLLAGRQAGKQAGKASIWAGRCLRIADGSSISQRGSKGTDWRIHGVYDRGLGGFSHLQITDVHGAESLLHCAPAGKEVLIADRGYAKAKALQACLHRSGPQGRDFIVRTGWRALVLRDREGAPFDLIAHLADVPAGDTPREWTVRPVLDGRKQPILPMIRRIAQPLPPDKVEAACVKLRQAASRKQQKLDPRTLLAAGFMVLATSLPDDIPAEDICAVYRLRWQIELAFRRLNPCSISIEYQPEPRRGAELALSAPDPHPTDRRHLPGFPGIFPLRTCSPTAVARSGGLPRSRSTLWFVDCPDFPSALSSLPIRPRIICSPIRGDPARGRDSDAAIAYPDAYVVLPGPCPWSGAGAEAPRCLPPSPPPL